MSFNIQDLDKVDDNNQQNWPEGTQKVNEVNNAGRADEGMLARWFADWNGSKITAGTATAYTITSDTVPTAYYDGFFLVAEIHVENTGAATLNADSLGAVNIVKNGGEALEAGDLPAGHIAIFVYRGTDFNLIATKIGSAGTKNTGTAIGDVVELEDVNGSAGLPAVDGSQLTGIQSPPQSTVFMYRQSDTLLRLRPHDGGYLWIDGENRQLGGEIDLDFTGTGNNQHRYVYALMNGANVELEASSTVPVRNAVTGMWEKTAETSKALVGMIQTNGSGNLQDQASYRGVRSWFNEPKIAFQNFRTSDLTLSTTWQSAGVACDVLTWPSEIATFSGAGTLSHSGAGVETVPSVNNARQQTGGTSWLGEGVGYNSMETPNSLVGMFEVVAVGLQTFDFQARLERSGSGSLGGDKSEPLTKAGIVGQLTGSAQAA